MNHTLRRAWPLVAAAAVLAAVLALGRVGRADYVYLNDGTVLRGRVEREGVLTLDPASKQDYWLPKAGGFYMVNDFARRFVFSQRNVEVAQPDPDDADGAEEIFHFRPPLGRTPRSKIITSVRIIDAEAWKEDGYRNITIEYNKDGTLTVETFKQYLAVVTPRFIRAELAVHHWTCSLLPDEIPREVMIEVIRKHLQGRANMTDLERHQTVLRYCVQVGWFEEAEREADAVAKQFPEEKPKLEVTRKKLGELQAAKWQKEVERAIRGGQHGRARDLLVRVPPHANDEIRRKADSQVKRYQEKEAALTEAKRLLDLVWKQANPRKLPETFPRALSAIAQELHLDTVGRLDVFVRLSAQEERNRKNQRQAEYTPEQLLAFAVSGWVIGSAAAESDPAVAHAFWYTREFLLTYLSATEARERKRLLGEYMTGKDGKPQPRAIDEVAQIIELLPPPLAEVRLTGFPRSYQTPVRTAYTVVLPPEYHHQRAYPMLTALPNFRETVRQTIGRYAELAARDGYILLIPEWADASQNAYGGTEKEHEIVIEAIHDVRRRFHVDAGRVFLIGFDEAGKAAYDIGLSYPHLFAGVSVIAGRPDGKLFSQSVGGGVDIGYKCNAQHLPFYVVDGSFNAKHLQGNKEKENVNRATFKHWVPAGYPAIYVEYIGRGLEFFAAELPAIFDWMWRKERAKGLPELGRGDLRQEFVSVRSNDNRFYWISFDPEQRLANSRARVSGQIAGANLLIVRLAGLKGATIWLNSSMVDFDQPVTVRVFGVKAVERQLSPDLKVLLEDYYQRGDKKNLYLAKIDVP